MIKIKESFPKIATFLMTKSRSRSILSKISINGTDFAEALSKEIPFESMPAMLGGGLQSYNESFEFDVSKEGPFYSPPAVSPLDSIRSPPAAAITIDILMKMDRRGRWFAAEYDKLAEMKRRLSSEIAASPPYPDVIGERRMIRFLRGKDGNVDQATKLYGDFLKWRRENGVDEIRDKILNGGINHPFKFPMGEKIIELQPQIVMAPKAFDNQGQPITLETFGFDPDAVFKHVTIEQYLTFLIYSLEFRALVMEQLSEEREREYLREHLDPSSRQEGYGVLVKQCTIRDLKGWSLS